MTELASSIPTSAGLYYFSAKLAPETQAGQILLDKWLCLSLGHRRQVPILRSASFITSVTIPHGITGIDLRGHHLAVIGYGSVRVSHIRSFEVEFGHVSSVMAIATIRVMTPNVLRATSFSILDESRFLLAGPKGIAIYKLPARAIAAGGSISYRVRALWRYSYDEEDTLSWPPLGPIRRNCGGKFTISVSGGNYLRCVYEVPGPGSKSHFIVKERRLIDRLPVYLGIAAGYQVGVYRRPYSMPAFTSFSLDGQPTELHPVFYANDRIVARTGSIVYRAGVLETLEPGTLQVYEDQGRILFILRSHVKPSAKVVVIEPV
ncbi:hypothetical protein DFH09DRAFT_1304157 [Mycena vulgaris]|nr:hypothetical protein DFH09DRAFT_1304157 [Mycena vulgaris]